MARGQKLGDRSARHDAAYRRAKQENFAARAIYKLEEIDKRFHLVKRDAKVLDLGCWPGSWMQYVSERVGKDGRVVGVDLRPVEIALPEWVTSLEGDVEALKPAVLGRKYGPFDLVLSDMAPQTTGDRGSDQWRCEELFLRALTIATAVLRPGGHFAAKVFQGGRFGELLTAVRANFQETKAFRPKSTRRGSTEQYIVGRGFRRAAATPDEKSASEG